MSERKLPLGENLVFEDSAKFIGGSTFLEAPLKGALVLTNQRIFFEEHVGRRNKRTLIRLEVPLSILDQVKISRGRLWSRTVITLIYRSKENTLEQPSFSVRDYDSWKASFSRVSIGGLRIV
ncbi:MAG: hypothetical protein NZ873_00725 [Crenarchaeota archaeon]|nr:hypothetical protein [Thermoproteota archaeon]MDW8033693.1 hypothetical protein [Nitrososphaerota archaeon]